MDGLHNKSEGNQIPQSSNVEMVRRCWEAWQSGRVFAATELFHRDASIRTAVNGWKPVLGLREVDALVDQLSEEGVRIEAEAERWEDLGDYVLVHGSSTITRGGLAQRTKQWWIFYVRDGKVASVTTKLEADEAFEHILWDRR